MLEFSHPWVLVVLGFVPFLIWWYSRWGKHREGTVQFSSLDLVKRVSRLSGWWKVRLLWTLRMTVIGLIILGLARPRAATDLSRTRVNVLDIVLVLDISSSMRAEDFLPNRLEAAKSTAIDFIKGRRGDRIGLLVFAGESYIQCPLTIDYDVLEDLLGQVEIIDEAHDGTAIGMAIAHGINRLRGGGTKNKVMVLLSDGSNNMGELDPVTAAGFARDYGIKIYTIGVGSRGKAPYPVDDPVFGRRYVQVDVDMNESTLEQVAEETEGQYFRATDEENLARIYGEIDQLEKSEITVKEYRQYKEFFALLLFPAVLLAMGEGALSQAIFRRKD
ncbi:MAG: VWA domain-containing protein [Candidatus Neomarinimicrobiota bacterium]